MAELLRLFDGGSGSAPEGASSARDTSTRGHVAELLAEIRLLRLGHTVARPTVDTGVDLVVNHRVAVQVKSAQLSTIRAKGHQYSFHVFGKQKPCRWGVDVYLLYGYRDWAADESGTWWVVPVHVLDCLGPRGSISLAYDRVSGLSSKLAEFIDAWGVFDGP